MYGVALLALEGGRGRGERGEAIVSKMGTETHLAPALLLGYFDMPPSASISTK